MSMSILTIRPMLHEMADRMYADGLTAYGDELHWLAEETRRRPAVRRAPVQRKHPTKGMREEIRAYAAAHPDLDNMAIGLHFDVNTGRVSEALAGFNR